MTRRPPHNIGKSDASRTGGMLPGYGAMRLSPRRRRTARTSLILIALGILVLLTLVAGVFRPGF